MAKRVVTPEQFMAASFPTQGVDAAMEFWRQRPLTTPRGVNVRTQEPRGQMDRGGSRQGLVRYIDARVNGDHLIQMLDVVVDPQAPGLNADTGDQPAGYIPDPSTNNLADRGSINRFVPPHGSGRPPNRNVPGSSTGPQLVQVKTLTLGSDVSGVQSITFDAPTTVGNLILCCVATGTFALGSSPGATHLVTVRNNALTDLANVGGVGYYADVTAYPSSPGPGDIGGTISGSMWYLVSASASDQTIKVNLGGLCTPSIGVMEFSGLLPAGVLDQFNKWQTADVAFTPPETAVVGAAVGVGGTAEVVVACGFGQLSDSSPTPTSGWTIAAAVDGVGSQITLAYRKNVSNPTTPQFDCTMSTSSGFGSHCGVVASFKKS